VTSFDGMALPLPSNAAPAAVEINGFALREIRVRSGVETLSLAEQIGVSRSYITRLELGQRERVSPRIYQALLSALFIRDRRTLLANPHGAVAGDEQVPA